MFCNNVYQVFLSHKPFMFTNDISCASYYIRIVAPPGVCFEHQYLLIVRLKIFGDRKKCHLLQLYIFSFSALHKPQDLTFYIVCCNILFSTVLAALKHMHSDYLIGSVTYNQMTQTCATVQELKLVSSCITIGFNYSFRSFYSFFVISLHNVTCIQ